MFLVDMGKRTEALEGGMHSGTRVVLGGEYAASEACFCVSVTHF